MAAPITLRNIRDSYVTQARPNKNFVNTARLKLDNSTGAVKYAYLFWGKPMPAGATMSLGKLRVWNAEAWAGSVTLTVERLAGSWAGARVNWTNKPGVAGTTYTLTKSGAAKNTMWELDILTLLQFVANGGNWYGVRISVNGGTVRNIYSAQAEQSDFRPQVLMQWSDAPDEPDGLAPSNNNAVSVAKPTLTYEFTDVSGDVNLAMQKVQIDDASDFATPIYDSGWVSATEPIIDLNASPYNTFAGLANLDSRWWRVMAQDGAGSSSPWSDPVQFRRVDKGTLTSSALGSKINATNLITDPSNVSSTWTGVNSSGLTTVAGASMAYSAAVAGSAGSTFTTIVRLKNMTTTAINGIVVAGRPTAAGSFGALVAANPVTVNLGPNEVKDFVHIAALPSGADGLRAAFTPPAGAAIGAIDMEMATIISGSSSVTQAFSGASVDTDVVGPYSYAWTGTANASTSTQTMLYVEDTSPTIVWAVGGGRTQTAYRVMVAPANDPNKPVYDSGKVTSSTTNSITLPNKTLKNSTTIYRLTIWVWDDIQRQKEGKNPIHYEYVRDFYYSPGTSVTAPTSLSVALSDPWPWVDLTFQRSTPPDSFSVWRNDELVENDLDPGTLWVSGTTYTYRDRLAPPRQTHTWTVKANVNGIDSAPSAGASAKPSPRVTWMMERDSTNPVAFVKSASEPTPAVDAQTNSAQTIHKPLEGEPVLITQDISGFEGRVEAVFADDVVAGLSARTMRNRFKAWKKTPGITLLLYMVDEVLEVVPYNMTYRPRAKSGGVILYDVSFDFFEVNYS